MIKFESLIQCICILLFLSSCQKDLSPQNLIPKDSINIKLDIKLFVVNAEESSSLKKITSTNIIQQSNGKDIEIGQDYFANIQVKQSAIVSKGTNFVKDKVASLPGTTYPVIPPTNVSPLKDGVFYMVLIFDSTDNHIATALGESSKNAQIRMKVPKSYVSGKSRDFRMVVFSYNTTDSTDYPNLDPAISQNNPRIILPNDQEFLYHNGSIPILYNEDEVESNPIAVEDVYLYPQTSKIGFTINAKDAESKVKRVVGSFDNFAYKKTAQLDLKLNQVISILDLSDAQFPYSFDVTGTADTLELNRYVYVDEDVPAVDRTVNVKVNFSQITLMRRDTTDVDVVSQLFSYDFGDVIINPSKMFNGRLNLFTGLSFDGIIWAPGNLYYDSNAPEGARHKIRSSAKAGRGEAFKYTDYWRPFYLHPTGEGGAQGDPCTLASPAGWKIPNKDQAFFMINDNFLPASITQTYNAPDHDDFRELYGV